MMAWGIGQQGFSAYRHQFCSRTLVSQFSWGALVTFANALGVIAFRCLAVWISMLTMSIFLSPALKLLQTNTRVQALKAQLTRITRRIMCKGDQDDEKKAVKVPGHHVHDLVLLNYRVPQEPSSQQTDIVATYRTLLVVVAFGSLCPLLFLMAPLFVFSNLCAVSWIGQQRGVYTTHQVLARKLMVQHPTTLFSLFAVFSQWAVAALLFVDFQFGIGPICFYVCCWVVGLSVWYYLRWKKARQSPSATKAQHTLSNEHWQRRFSKSALIGTGEVCLEKNPVASHVEHSKNNQREAQNAEHFDSIQGGTQYI